jgi:hypothetical protein
MVAADFLEELEPPILVIAASARRQQVRKNDSAKGQAFS